MLVQWTLVVPYLALHPSPCTKRCVYLGSVWVWLLCSYAMGCRVLSSGPSAQSERRQRPSLLVKQLHWGCQRVTLLHLFKQTESKTVAMSTPNRNQTSLILHHLHIAQDEKKVNMSGAHMLTSSFQKNITSQDIYLTLSLSFVTEANLFILGHRNRPLEAYSSIRDRSTFGHLPLMEKVW